MPCAADVDTLLMMSHVAGRLASLYVVSHVYRRLDQLTCADVMPPHRKLAARVCINHRDHGPAHV